MSQPVLTSPIIVSCSALDNVSNDSELLTISSIAPSSIYPTYAKLIIDNISDSNSLSQLVINLKTDDYFYSSTKYLINLNIPVESNKQYSVKAKIFYSDGTSTPYSLMKSFTSAPTPPEILSVYGDAKNSIFLSIKPQSEVISYSVILGYVDNSNNQQLDVIDSINTTDDTKKFIQINNLLQDVTYSISLIAVNNNGSSQISNTVSSTTKPVPDPVTNFTSSFNPIGDIFLNWTPPSNSIHVPVTKYKIITNWGEIFIDGNLSTYTFFNNAAVGLLYNFSISAIHSDLNDTNKDLITEYESSKESTSVYLPEASEVQNLVSSVNPSTLLITLNWNPPANNNIITTTSYDIKFNGEFYQNITTTTLSYSLTVPGGVYSFDITPLHFNDKSTQHKSINVQIPTSGSPVNLTSSYDKSCNIVLNWSAPVNNSAITATSYNIYDASNTLIVSTYALTYTFLNQVCGKVYSYTVKSVYNSFEGGSASTSLSLPIPSPANAIGSSFDTSGSISLTWNYQNETPVNIDNFQIFDVYNNVLSPSIPANPSTLSYFFVMGNAYPLGASYSFYIISYNKGVPSLNSNTTLVSLPIPSVPLNLIAINNATTPPNASLSWSAPANNNVISSDSYNIYQDGMLLSNVVTPAFNTNALIAGQTYSFVVKPLHGNVEFNSPASVSLTAYQPSSQPTNLYAQPKNNTIILTWDNALNTGGLTPSQFLLSYIDDTGNLSQTTIIYNANGAYSRTISGLTNKKSYTFQLYLITGSGSNQLSGQTATIAATPSGSPIVNSISFVNKTLSASIDGNGSNLLGNFIIISYDSNNIPSVQQYVTPSVNATTGLYSINQLLLPATVKASIICANGAGITGSNSWS